MLFLFTLISQNSRYVVSPDLTFTKSSKERIFNLFIFFLFFKPKWNILLKYDDEDSTESEPQFTPLRSQTYVIARYKINYSGKAWSLYVFEYIACVTGEVLKTN